MNPYIILAVGVGLTAICLWFYIQGKKAEKLKSAVEKFAILQGEKKDLKRWVKDVDALADKAKELKDEVPCSIGDVGRIVGVLHKIRGTSTDTK